MYPFFDIYIYIPFLIHIYIHPFFDIYRYPFFDGEEADATAEADVAAAELAVVAAGEADAVPAAEVVQCHICDVSSACCSSYKCLTDGWICGGVRLNARLRARSAWLAHSMATGSPPLMAAIK